MSRGVFRDLTGRRIGEWTVLRRVIDYVAPCGQHATMWLCRCSCGAEHHVAARALMETDGRAGASRRCAECAKERNVARQREEVSTPLPDGRTIARIAAASGLKLDTVYRRWLRGWPLDMLGSAHRSAPGKGHKGLGGSADLPERRGTVYGRRAG